MLRALTNVVHVPTAKTSVCYSRTSGICKSTDTPRPWGVGGSGRTKKGRYRCANGLNVQILTTQGGHFNWQSRHFFTLRSIQRSSPACIFYTLLRCWNFLMRWQGQIQGLGTLDPRKALVCPPNVAQARSCHFIHSRALHRAWAPPCKVSSENAFLHIWCRNVDILVCSSA